MIVKINEYKEGPIICVVDNDILNKKFEDGDLQLDLTSDFYKGEDKDPRDIGDLMRNAYGINLVGEKAIQLAIDEGLIDESMVKKISNIPYYQGAVNLD